MVLLFSPVFKVASVGGRPTIELSEVSGLPSCIDSAAIASLALTPQCQIYRIFNSNRFLIYGQSQVLLLSKLCKPKVD